MMKLKLLRPVFTSLGPFLVLRVHLFLLLKILLVLLLGQLLDLFRSHQVTVQDAATVADFIDIAVCH